MAKGDWHVYKVAASGSDSYFMDSIFSGFYSGGAS